MLIIHCVVVKLENNCGMEYSDVYECLGRLLRDRKPVRTHLSTNRLEGFREDLQTTVVYGFRR